MTIAIDLTDVALVAPETMAVPMQHMIDTGRGLVLLKGASSAELREMDQAVWDELGDDPGERVAALLRFRCLIEVFSAQRLRQMLLQKGFALLSPVMQVAARMRLNGERGFNPAKFERALRAELADKAVRSDPRVPARIGLHTCPSQAMAVA